MRLLHSCLFLITPISSVFVRIGAVSIMGCCSAVIRWLPFLFLYLFCRLVASDGSLYIVDNTELYS